MHFSKVGKHRHTPRMPNTFSPTRVCLAYLRHPEAGKVLCPHLYAHTLWPNHNHCKSEASQEPSKFNTYTRVREPCVQRTIATLRHPIAIKVQRPHLSVCALCSTHYHCNSETDHDNQILLSAPECACPMQHTHTTIITTRTRVQAKPT